MIETAIRGRGPMTGYREAPPQVRVGRGGAGQIAAQTQVGRGPNDPGFDPSAAFPPEAGPNLWCSPRDRARSEPLGSKRALVLSGATQEFLFNSCTPFRLHYFTVPESFALNFTILSIFICRENMIEGEVPAEAFSDQAGFVNNIVGGRTIFPSVPMRVNVRNDSASDVFFNAMAFGSVLECG
jgi:hypothetical protein